MTEPTLAYYTPLDPIKREIRLITLKSLAHIRSQQLPDETICCEFIRTSLFDPINYTALSYAWEDLSNKQNVNIEGHVQGVSSNLAAALRTLRDEHSDTMLWADQLCIHQLNDAEKSHQVGMMKDIYERAMSVTVWLGPTADDSDMIVATLKEVSKYSEETLEDSASILSDIVQGLKQQVGTACSDQQPYNTDTILARLQTAFECFCRRSYWKRLWVIQEFAIAQVLNLVCGSANITFHDFRTAWWLLSRLRDHAKRYPNSPRDSMDILAIAKQCWSVADSFASGIITRRQKTRLQLSKGEKTEGLFSTMSANLILETDYNQPLTSDPRDRVFSLLGLAGDRDKFGHFPDYSKTVEEVYEQLALDFLRQGHIDNFAHCQSPRLLSKLPTWVPDWSMPIQSPVIGHPLLSWFTAGGNQLPSQCVVAFESGRITLRGYYVERIQSLGSYWDPNWLEVVNFHDLALYLSSIEEFCRKSPRIRPEDIEIDCARIAMGDRVNFRIKSESTDDFLRQSYRIVAKWAAQGIESSNSNSSDVEQQSLPADRAARAYIGVLLRLHSRRTFISHTGYIGLAPTGALENDVICIFPGGRGVYILRPVEDGVYSLVGEAYVHGLMHGELLQTKPEIRPFVLV